jgi:hypothetical protein
MAAPANNWRWAGTAEEIVTMIFRAILLSGLALQLVACTDPSAPRPPIINSGSYDWTDQVRDARGYPLQGWGNIISPNGGDGGSSR